MQRKWIALVLGVGVIAGLLYLRSADSGLDVTWVAGRSIDVPLEPPPRFIVSHVPEAHQSSVPPTSVGWIFLPRNARLPAGRAVLVFGPEGQNVRALDDVSDRWAEALNAVVLTVALDPGVGTWGSFLHAAYLIDRGRASGLLTDDARVVVGGFSGGGKMATAVGAAAGPDYVSGVLAVAVNQEFASEVLRQGAPEASRGLPFIILNGDADPIVSTGQNRTVIDGLQRAGIADVRERSFSGGHSAPNRETLDAFNELLDGI